MGSSKERVCLWCVHVLLSRYLLSTELRNSKIVIIVLKRSNATLCIRFQCIASRYFFWDFYFLTSLRMPIWLGQKTSTCTIVQSCSLHSHIRVTQTKLTMKITWPFIFQRLCSTGWALCGIVRIWSRTYQYSLVLVHRPAGSSRGIECVGRRCQTPGKILIIKHLDRQSCHHMMG